MSEQSLGGLIFLGVVFVVAVVTWAALRIVDRDDNDD